MIYQISNIIFQVKDLSLSYGSKTILHNINLEVKDITRPGISQGQIVCLLGPSGSGKTQLFKCLSGLQKPTSGEIKLFQKDPVKAGDVGVVFQNYPVLKHRTVLSNLKFAAKQAGKPLEEIMSLLREFHMEERKDLYPIQLSGGQRQRVAIMQQVLCGSHFILMDEPFSGLDLIMKQKAVDLILKVSLKDEYNTIIITTHDIATALIISDTIWVLGRIPDQEGATIVKCYNLIERGLAWNPDVEKHPNFYSTMLEIKELFKTL